MRLRIFVSSPGDVPDERLRASLIIDKLAQEFRRYFTLEVIRWEHEPLIASGHFQDALDPPSETDIVVLILWSRLGTPLPEKTGMREYRGIDGRAPVTGTEWEYEDALKAARERGAPDLLAFRNRSPTPIDPRDPEARARSNAQLDALDAFWHRHFADRGVFLAAYEEYATLEQFAARLEESLRKLIERRIKALPADETGDQTWFAPPFRGLQAYGFEHAPIYFGRDEAVAKAAEQLAVNARAGTAFLLVSGASGSGKSSLVQAAVVPRLMRPQRIEGVGFARRLVFRPGGGRDPILGLIEALTRAADDEGVGLPELLAPGQSAAELAAHVREGPDKPGFVFAGALGRLTQAARTAGHLLAFESAKLILVIDQLEELFTTTAIGADDRRLFARLIAGLARSGAVWVVATLRADFWHRAAEIPELLEIAQGAGRIDLAAPDPAELAEMIRKPAQAAGLKFGSHERSGLGLDVVIAADTVAAPGPHGYAGAAPGVLPLLSFLLDELYAEDVVKAGGRTLTPATYEALGGLRGAISKRAEDVVAGLPEAARAAVPRVLRTLVTVTGGSEQAVVARTVPRARFADATPARVVVEAFTAERLIVADEAGATPTVRLAHEALIGHWERARHQFAADRRDLETRTLVERQQARWEQASGKGRTQLLLRDPDLANAIDLSSRWDDELAVATRTFIAESKRHARLRNRLTAAAAATFGVVAVAAIIATVFVSIEQRRAEQARDSERMEKEFIASVAETMQELAGFVPEETEQLMRKTTQAILTGRTTDADSVTLMQVDALAEMAGYFHDAWDDGRAMKFLDNAQKRLSRVGTDSVSSPEYTRLRARLMEIVADVDADDDRRFDRAAREYDGAIEVLNQYRRISSSGALASARVHRKRAAFEIIKGENAAADSDIGVALGLLDESDEAQSERAALYDIQAGEAARNKNLSKAAELLQRAARLDRRLLAKARQAGQPIRAATILLATHLQHLGDALRQNGKADAASAYKEAEMLTTEILNTYPNQAGSRFMLDLIRHGHLLLINKGLIADDRINSVVNVDDGVDKRFGEGFGRFKFGMSVAQVNALLDHPFGNVDRAHLPIAREYWTGEVRYFWVFVANAADFRSVYDLSRACLKEMDYVVFMFHEDSLMRISYRLYGSPQVGCRDRNQLFPALAEQYQIPLLGTPKSWRLRWETGHVSLVGATFNEGPMLDIIAR